MIELSKPVQRALFALVGPGFTERSLDNWLSIMSALNQVDAFTNQPLTFDIPQAKDIVTDGLTLLDATREKVLIDMFNQGLAITLDTSSRLRIEEAHRVGRWDCGPIFELHLEHIGLRGGGHWGWINQGRTEYFSKWTPVLLLEAIVRRYKEPNKSTGLGLVDPTC
jgi:hypothetical protein